MGYRTIRRSCFVCGKEFNIKIRNSDNKILTKCFYAKMPAGHFNYWLYRVEDRKNLLITELVFINKFWMFLGYTKLQRAAVEWIWGIFHRRKIEYWECPSCCKKLSPSCCKKLSIHYEHPKGRYRCNHAVGKGKPEKLTKNWNEVTCKNCLNWRKPNGTKNRKSN